MRRSAMDELDRRLEAGLRLESEPPASEEIVRRARRRRGWRVAGSVVAVGLVVLGCVTAGVLLWPSERPGVFVGNQPGDPAVGSAESYTSTSISDDGESVELFDGVTVEVTLRIDGTHGWVRWRADCDLVAGGVEFVKGRLGVESMTNLTGRTCDGPSAQRDEWLQDFFVSDPTWQLEDGTLTLNSSTQTLRLRSLPTAELAAADATQLWGHTFISTAAVDGWEPVELFFFDRIEVAFQDGAATRKVRWKVGNCSSTADEVSLAEGRVRVGGGVTSETSCDDQDVLRQQWLSEFFASDPTWQFDNGWLTLTDGQRALVLRDLDDVQPGQDQAVSERAAGARDLAVGHGSLWVAAPDNSVARAQGTEYVEVIRLNPFTSQVEAAIEVDSPVDQLAVTDSAVYTLDHAGFVGRIDPTSNGFTSAPVAAGEGELAAHGDDVWLATAEDPRLLRLDPESLTVGRTVPVEGLTEVRDLLVHRDAQGVRLAMAGVGRNGAGAVTTARADSTEWRYSTTQLSQPVNRIVPGEGGLWATYAPKEPGGPAGAAFLAETPDGGLQASQPAATQRAYGQITLLPDGDVLVGSVDGQLTRLRLNESGSPTVAWRGHVGDGLSALQATNEGTYWAATRNMLLELDLVRP